MLFRIIELYQQGQEFKSNPAEFGASMGVEALAPLFIMPAIGLACAAFGCMALWWWTGWGIFIAGAIICWLLICAVHGMYKTVHRLFGAGARHVVNRFEHYRSDTETESTIIDVKSAETQP